MTDQPSANEPSANQPSADQPNAADELQHLVSIDQIVKLAAQRIESGPYVWADAAAGQEVTSSRNTRTLESLALVPQLADLCPDHVRWSSGPAG